MRRCRVVLCYCYVFLPVSLGGDPVVSLSMTASELASSVPGSVQYHTWSTFERSCQSSFTFGVLRPSTALVAAPADDCIYPITNDWATIISDAISICGDSTIEMYIWATDLSHIW
ncbi:hypothetical protein CBL_05528 [Carabus blaptoides fortunei]